MQRDGGGVLKKKMGQFSYLIHFLLLKGNKNVYARQNKVIKDECENKKHFRIVENYRKSQ